MKKYKYTIDDLATAKGGLISLSIFTLAFIGVFVFFYFNYEDYSETVFSVKYQKDIEKGWAPTVVGWGVFAIPLAIIGIFMLSQTRDFKEIGVGVDDYELYLNTGMIKGTRIPLSNISEINQNEHNIEIKLKDYSQMVNDQFFLFRAIIRNNYEKKGTAISITKNDFEDEKGGEVFDFIKSKI